MAIVFRTIPSQLSRRFGNVDQAIALKIRELEIAKLEELGENLFDFSQIDDLYDWLKQNS